jgi:hypothetical protein
LSSSAADEDNCGLYRSAGSSIPPLPSLDVIKT